MSEGKSIWGAVALVCGLMEGVLTIYMDEFCALLSLIF